MEMPENVAPEVWVTIHTYEDGEQLRAEFPSYTEAWNHTDSLKGTKAVSFSLRKKK